MPDSDRDDADSHDGGSVASDGDAAGALERTIAPGSTLEFVTRLEIVELLRSRMIQINDPEGKHNEFSPRVIDRLGAGASEMAMLLAELLDPGWEYPLQIKRGAARLRLHRDLIVIDEIVDIVVMHTQTGETSFDSIREDIRERPTAENLTMQMDLKELERIRQNMAGRPV
jgi:hypothetical protein